MMRFLMLVLVSAAACLVAGPVYANCSSPAGVERDMFYNGDYHTYQFCNGTAWVTVGGLPPAQFTHNGYFVLTQTTWTRSLGTNINGFQVELGANALCLTELATTHTGWKGYATANANGQLVADKVHAFICNNGNQCETLVPLATYAFANAADGTAGGATFTTNSVGEGPGDNANWSGSTYFNGDFKYWTGSRIKHGTTLWGGANSSGQDCETAAPWDTGTSAKNGEYGESANTNGSRWSQTTNEPCNNTHALICFVDP